jgi:hypothetical protein
MVLFKAPVYILGYLMVPLVYRYRDTDLKDLPFWAKLWANPEDWTGGTEGYTNSLPHWWKMREGNDFKAFYKYHAFRNGADGLRNFPKLQLRINPDRVEYWTPKYFRHYEPWYDRTPGLRFYIAWQGVWMGLKLQRVKEDSYWEVKWGWRVHPSDAHHSLAEDSARRILGASFANKYVRREL